MKIINIVIEIITAPFALLLRLSSNKKIIFHRWPNRFLFLPYRY